MLRPAIGRWIETPMGTLSLAAIPAFELFKILQIPRRLSKVSKTKERVLVLGATSGIGRSIARQYAERGGALVDEVVEECRQARSSLRDVFRLLTEFWGKGTSPAARLSAITPLSNRIPFGPAGVCSTICELERYYSSCPWPDLIHVHPQPSKLRI